MNVRQQPRKVFFIKKEQVRELRLEYLSPVRQKRQPVNTDVKRVCLQIAQKNLSKSAVQFYRTLPSIKEENLMKHLDSSKECYLFFYLDHLIRKQQFLRANLKFLLEGHTKDMGRHFTRKQKVKYFSSLVQT